MNRYRFSQFELQPDERRLLAAGVPIRIGPHAFDLLLELVEHSGRLALKEELLERVWPKVVVEENALQVQISALRKILGAGAIETVSGRGYRFALDVTSVKKAAAANHNLPNATTTFIGRKGELDELRDLINRSRLVTLTGSGGCGKTRLALELAGQVVQDFEDGARFIELAVLDDATLVDKEVAKILGVKERSGESLTRTLGQQLATKHCLLLLDNAEHVLTACSTLIDNLLRNSNRLTVLVTSRERLGVAGELTFRVPSLPIPTGDTLSLTGSVPQVDSVQLFVDRVRLHRPHFEVTEQNAAALASICRRLDGIPLAIELAAPRMRAMTLDEIDRRLDQRFALLTQGSRTSLPRHRTLAAAIDWSFNLLNEAEKAVLCRAAVFSGGWSLSAAEDVCAGPDARVELMLDLLTSLVDKSLIMVRDMDGQSRYAMLETVHHYVRERITEHPDDSVSAKHLHYFVRFASESLLGLKGAGQQAAMVQVEIEHDNFRVALKTSVRSDQHAALGLRMMADLAWFWAVHGHVDEGRSWLVTLLAYPAVGDDRQHRAKALAGAAVFASQQGDQDTAKIWFRQSLDLYEQIAYRTQIAYVLRSLGNVALAEGDWPEARSLYEQSLVIVRELDEQHTIAGLLGAIGEVAGEQGDYSSARRMLEDCLTMVRETGDRWTTAWTLARLGRVAYSEGHLRDAESRFKAAMTMQLELDDKWGIAWFLEGYAAVVAALAQPLHGALMWGAAEQLREELDAPLPFADRSGYDRAVDAARQAGGHADFDAAWQEGRKSSVHRVIRDALERDDLML